MVFDRRLQGKPVLFIPDRFALNGNLLMRQSDATKLRWSQVGMGCLEAPHRRLRLLPSSLMRWSEWREMLPSTTVMKTTLGLGSSENLSPTMEDYLTHDEVPFPFYRGLKSDQHHNKESMLLAHGSKGFVAYPVRLILEKLSPESPEFFDAENGLKVRKIGSGASFAVTDVGGRSVPSGLSFWYAIQAFQPDISVYPF